MLKRFFSGLSFRLQSMAIFLSLLGIAFAVCSYLHIRNRLGTAESQVFADNLIVQIAVTLIANITVALILYQIVTQPIKKLGQAMNALSQNNLDTEIPYVDARTEIGHMARRVKIFK